ncbi:uncharacterized protein LOC119069705 [Bradysia coprophila]|uniref:uncharacterized protein LOC119069705 n=1 Tax=Bradysia coprophila TaxID=38358 RepID=UPI00187DCA58|nr:uncharacterized protein LOC119069705 [Bradysia coprophila]
MNELIQIDTVEEELDKEAEDCENYRNRVTLRLLKIEELTKPPSEDRSIVGTIREAADKSKRTYKLPKIEIKKFNGEILEWLSFWSQFDKIHKDDDLHNSDKFQYLTQAIMENTRAKELVNSYPQTSENYPKVVAALKERFGKPKILKQVYVRELIKMIANNVRTKDKVSISKLFDNLESHLRALETLGVTGEQTAEFVFPMVESILPEEILIAWQRSPNFGRDGSAMQPPLSELDFLMSFLRQEVESEQQRSLARTGFGSIYNKLEEKKTLKKIQSKVATASSLYVGDDSSCLFCEKTHPSNNCGKAVEMSFKAKKELLNKKGACHKCLKVHDSKNCRTYIKCTGCSKPHFHVMCPDSPKNKETVVNTASNVNSIVKQVLLKTILVTISSRIGKKTIRVLFDDGSQQSYIKSEVAKYFKCKENGRYFERNTLFGGILSEVEERTIYRVDLVSLNGKIKRCLELTGRSKLTGDIIKIPEGPWIDELKSKNIEINDMQSSGQDVDVLIGADLANFLISDQSITLKCGLKAVKTVFGWTVMGPVPVQNNFVNSHTLSMITDEITEKGIKNLWDLEIIGIRDPSTKKSQEDRDREAQEHFNTTVTRNDDGRYVVALPWVNGLQSIPNNFEVAYKRLVSTTKKLIKGNMYDAYNNMFQQWKDEGIIEEIKAEDISSMNGHFIPHQAVFKPESKTTPVRPVFDASCKVGRSPSLNECMEKGPNLIEFIPRSMLQFRENKIGAISDIRKAFQMIEIQEADQKYLMFLWWEDSSCKKLKVYKHKRVVFGVKSSPFILAAVLNKHLNDVKEVDADIAQKLLKSLYVDNSITSVNNWEDYEKYKQEAIRILADAKMDLREWEHSAVDEFSDETGEDEYSAVLGMKWNKKRDTISCTATPTTLEQLTKRTLLSTINKIFDPLGFLSPAMIFPKLTLQASWDKKLDWDDELPQDLMTQFKKWNQQLGYLVNVEIPRCIKGKHFNEESTMQIHVFNDASKFAYATVIFLRVETNKNISVQLIQAKTRIAPINQITIPRLELMACVLGTRLMNSVKDTLFTNIPCYYWTDSTTALAWISRNDEWGTFVGNRVKEIIGLTNVQQWFHVPGIKNPADLPSRGCTPKELLEARWWEGPEWLKLPKNEWPNEQFETDEDKVNEERKKSANIATMSNTTEKIEDPWFAKRQSHLLNLRILAWVQRFKNNCLARSKNTIRRSGWLTMAEVQQAEITMVRMIQQQSFPKDSEFIEGLRVKQQEEKLYYVKTKIMNRVDLGRFKQPLLLPHTHPVVDKIIEEEHKQHGHAGAQFLIAKLRERFWIVKTRKAVRRVIKKCVVCKRFGKAETTVPIAPLPENRVKDAKVFEVTGIDLAGPLYLKDNSKVWVVIFTCGIYRAVHIESVESINTEQFILALSRFISHCGRIAIIYSDNGTNFVKAASLFGKLDWKRIQEATNVHRIQWIFNPPASPWWGGFWERLVRTLKEYLRKILGNNKLNKVQLDTALAFVKSLMNSRPLTYITEDQDDLVPLTPAAFLRDIEPSEFPELVTLNESCFQRRYKELLTMKEELRSRFRSEYLGQLVQRSKPTQDIKFEVGDVVLVMDETKKRLEWPMAKIIEIFPGHDKKTRVARIKTKQGEIVRTLQRLVHLEVKASEINIQEEAVLKSKKLNKKTPTQFKLKGSVIENDQKEIITKSGRKVKTPIRFQF